MNMEITLKEFKKQHKKVSDKRNHKIINSLGIRQAFLFVQRNKWFDIGQVLKESQFQQIVRQVNTLLAYEIMEGNEVVFPQKMGSIELRTLQARPTIEDGKLRISYPVNWDETLKLWYEDSEAYNNKILVYFDNPKGFKLVYNRAKANYNNKSFYQFSVNRDIKCIINRRIKQGKISDAFLV